MIRLQKRRVRRRRAPRGGDAPLTTGQTPHAGEDDCEDLLERIAALVGTA